jgi:L-amino acid N-acyltransferase YncA
MAIAAEIFAHYVTTSVATFETVPPTEEDWQRKLADVTGRGLPFLVGERDRRVAGYAYAAPWRTKPAYRHTVEDAAGFTDAGRLRNVGRKYGRLLDTLLMQRDLTT